MPVIAIINQKGGVGKTCLATNLASALRSQGPLLLLDCDPQGSASGWAALGPQPRRNLSVEGVEAGALVRRVRTAIDEQHRIVIDCPPGITRVECGRHTRGRRGADSLQAPRLGCMGLRGYRRSRKTEAWMPIAVGPRPLSSSPWGARERVSASRSVQPWLNWGCPSISRAPRKGSPMRWRPARANRCWTAGTEWPRMR